MPIRSIGQNRMTAHAALSQNRKTRRKAGGFLLLPFALFAAPLLLAASFVAYVLWPTWPRAPIALDAPALPITVAGTLFEVPPAAIRVAAQRHAGPQERIDLAFLWPSLRPPPGGKSEGAPIEGIDGTGPSASGATPGRADADGRLFATIAPLGQLLPPAERLRSIYPRYADAQAAPGADGLAVLPFRAGTPYEGEDLIYFADNPDRFYARCTRDSGVMPGSCIQERMLGDADMTLRFPRDWLDNWQGVSAGFDRLIAQLQPQRH